MQVHYIDTATQLTEICQSMASTAVLVLDTEFVRERTYYPKLGLIQLCDGNAVYLVDAVAIDDLSALIPLLTDPATLKLLHACGEDVEVFRHRLGVVPSPLLDTQIAATFAAVAVMPGYAKLVEAMLGELLDKQHARTNWLARPLSPEQLRYAAEDVSYLYQLYPQLEQRLQTRGWFDIALQESSRFIEDRTTDVDPDTLYFNVKNAWRLRGKSLALLKQLAAWRFAQAQRADRPIGHILRDDSLFDIAKLQPTSMQALHQIDSIPKPVLRKHGQTLISMVEQLSALPPEAYPAPIVRLSELPRYKGAMALLKQHAQAVADKLEIPVELLASKRLMHDLLEWLWIPESPMEEPPALMYGWRAAHFADKVEEVRLLNRSEG